MGENLNKLGFQCIFCKHVQQQKKKKRNISKNPGWGLTHPPISEFSRIFKNCFNLTKPLGPQQTLIVRFRLALLTVTKPVLSGLWAGLFKPVP